MDEENRGDETVDLFLYLCHDGIVRERCGAHVAERGDFAPVRWSGWLGVRQGARSRCVACYFERSSAASLAAVAAALVAGVDGGATKVVNRPAQGRSAAQEKTPPAVVGAGGDAGKQAVQPSLLAG